MNLELTFKLKELLMVCFFGDKRSLRPNQEATGGGMGGGFRNKRKRFFIIWTIVGCPLDSFYHRFLLHFFHF